MANDVTLRAIITGSSAGAVKAFEETALAADAAGKKAEGALDDVGEKFDEASGHGSSFVSKIGELGKAFTLAGGAGLVAVAGISVKLAEEFDQAKAQYDVATKNNGETTKAANAVLSQNIALMQQSGFTDTDTAASMAVLARSGENLTEQHKTLGVAADLARAKNISLADATTMLTQAQQGNQKALKTLGINQDLGSAKAKTLETDNKALSAANDNLAITQQKIADGSLKGQNAQDALKKAQDSVAASQAQLTKDHNSGNAVLDAVNSKVHGAADAYGKTLSGQIDIARVTVTNLATKFGEVLIPKITEAIHIVTSIVEWFEKHKAIAEALGVAIGTVLAGAIGVYITLTGIKMVKATQDALEGLSKFASKVMEIIPNFGEAGEAEEAFAATSEETSEAATVAFGPIGIAIMAVVAIGALLVTHWKQVKDFLTKTWNDIKDIAVEVWHGIEDFFKQWWPVVLGIMTGGLGLLIGELIQHWDTVKSDVSGMIDAVVGFFQQLPGRIVTALGDIVSTIWGALKKTGDWIENNVFLPQLNFFKQLPNRIFTALGDIVGVVFHGLTTVVTWLEQNVYQPERQWFTQLPSRLFSSVGDIVGTIFSGLSNINGWLDNNVWNPMSSWFSGLPGKIAGVLNQGVSVFDNVGKTIVNSIVDGINDIINTLDSGIGSISIFGFHPPSHIIPDIPHLVTGGYAEAGKPILVGEGGREIFTPSTSGTVTPNNRLSNASTGTTNHVNVNVATQADPYEIASEVGWAMRTAAV